MQFYNQYLEIYDYKLQLRPKVRKEISIFERKKALFINK